VSRKFCTGFVKIALAIVAFCALLTVACGGSSGQSSQTKAFCDDLSTLKTNLNSASNDLNSGDRQSAAKALTDAQNSADQVRTSGQSIKSSNAEQLYGSYNQLRIGLTSAVESGAAPGTAINSISSFTNAVSQTLSQYKCK
jgi:hypothetical protein